MSQLQVFSSKTYKINCESVNNVIQFIEMLENNMYNFKQTIIFGGDWKFELESGV